MENNKLKEDMEEESKLTQMIGFINRFQPEDHQMKRMFSLLKCYLIELEERIKILENG